MDDALARRRVDARGGRARPACRSSPATPRSSTAARATASSSTPPASALIPDGRRRSRPRAPGPGDVVLLSGAIAEHGIAIMSVREGLEFETAHRERLARRCTAWSARCSRPAATVHVLRDPTRGGVASALNEIAERRGVGHPARRDARFPVRDEVRGACEILGLDPLYVANEGKCLAIVAPRGGRRGAGDACARHPLGRARPRSSARWSPSTRAGSSCAAASAARASSTCSAASSCRGSAEAGSVTGHRLRHPVLPAARRARHPHDRLPQGLPARLRRCPTPRASRRARRSCRGGSLPALRRLRTGAREHVPGRRAPRGPGARRPQGRGRAESPGGDRGVGLWEGQHPRPQPPPGPGLPRDAPGCAAAAPQVSLGGAPSRGRTPWPARLPPVRGGAPDSLAAPPYTIAPCRARRAGVRAPATASPPALLRDPWALATLLAIVPLALRMLGAPLAEPVAEDFDFLHRALLQGFGSVLDGGGSLAFWRPIPTSARLHGPWPAAGDPGPRRSVCSISRCSRSGAAPLPRAPPGMVRRPRGGGRLVPLLAESTRHDCRLAHPVRGPRSVPVRGAGAPRDRTRAAAGRTRGPVRGPVVQGGRGGGRDHDAAVARRSPWPR